MKVIKKILIILAIVIMIIGMFLLGKNGLNYADGYTKNILLSTAREYILYVTISTIIILIYLAIKYNKQGIAKVIFTSIIGIVGTLVFTLAIITITRMPVTRIIFSILIASYVASIIAVTANFETNN